MTRKKASWISRRTIFTVLLNCSISSATRQQPIRRVRFRNSRSATMLTIILPVSRNGRWAVSRKAAAYNGILRHPGRHAEQTARGLKSKPVGVGFGQCRIGQDACSRQPCHPASPPRRRALKNPLPDLHQGGGGEHGRARVRYARPVDTACRRGTWKADHRGRGANARQPPIDRGTKTLCANGRNAGRPEGPDNSRVLRTAPAFVSLRGQCPVAL